MKKKLILAVVLVCVLLIGFAGCDSNPESINDPANVRELTMVVTADSISKLDQYPNLEKVDLTGSTCYAEMAAYA